MLPGEFLDLRDIGRAGAVVVREFFAAQIAALLGRLVCRQRAQVGPGAFGGTGVTAVAPGRWRRSLPGTAIRSERVGSGLVASWFVAMAWTPWILWIGGS
jgi:hypothetical protein